MPYQHSDDTRELAYQVWSYLADRDNTRTAVLVAERLPAGTRAPNAETIGAWSHQDDWAGRVRRDFTAIAPDVAAETVRNLHLSALYASRELLASMRDGSGDGKRARLIAVALTSAGYGNGRGIGEASSAPALSPAIGAGDPIAIAATRASEYATYRNQDTSDPTPTISANDDTQRSG